MHQFRGAPGQGDRKDQPGIGHQAVIVEGDTDAVGVGACSILGAPFLGPVFCFKTIIPDSEEHPLASSRAVPKAVLRWIRAKGIIRVDGNVSILIRPEGRMQPAEISLGAQVGTFQSSSGQKAGCNYQSMSN